MVYVKLVEGLLPIFHCRKALETEELSLGSLQMTYVKAMLSKGELRGPVPAKIYSLREWIVPHLRESSEIDRIYECLTLIHVTTLDQTLSSDKLAVSCSGIVGVTTLLLYCLPLAFCIHQLIVSFITVTGPDTADS